MRFVGKEISFLLIFTYSLLLLHFVRLDADDRDQSIGRLVLLLQLQLLHRQLLLQFIHLHGRGAKLLQSILEPRHPAAKLARLRFQQPRVQTDLLEERFRCRVVVSPLAGQIMPARRVHARVSVGHEFRCRLPAASNPSLYLFAEPTPPLFKPVCVFWEGGGCKSIDVTTLYLPVSLQKFVQLLQKPLRHRHQSFLRPFMEPVYRRAIYYGGEFPRAYP